MTPERRPRRADRRRLRPAVLAVVVVQVALPLALLGVRWVDEGSRPQTELPASWQMYTSAQPATYAGQDGAGRTRPLSAERLPPVVRAVDTGRTVPDRLCTAHPDLVAVTRAGGPDPGVFRC